MLKKYPIPRKISNYPSRLDLPGKTAKPVRPTSLKLFHYHCSLLELFGSECLGPEFSRRATCTPAPGLRWLQEENLPVFKYKIEKVGDFKKLAERAYQKKMVDGAEKKYLAIKEESKLTSKRVIMLEAEDTKTCEPRVVFLCQQAYDILEDAGKVRFLEHHRVFTYKGAPIKKVRKTFANACRKAGINDFRFHGLRHTFITNMHKAGVDQSVIMKLTGHWTPAMFQRYHTIDLEDAQGAYQKLEELLGKEQEWGTTRTRSAPLVLPRVATAELDL
jgi:hypothetical protein